MYTYEDYESALKKNQNIDDIIRRTRDLGEGRISEHDIEKIYRPSIEKNKEIIHSYLLQQANHEPR